LTKKRLLLSLLALVAAGGLLLAGWGLWRPTASSRPPTPGHRAHLDHSSFFDQPFQEGPEVTRACLRCHPNAGRQLLGSTHFTWLAPPAEIPGRTGIHAVGKRNLINNFCIGITSNETMCTKCHAGYGWRDGRYDFTREENVDCLVCHDWSGSYLKGDAGLPVPGTDLRAVARSVGYPRLDNCGVCHFFGGGGMGVKHGDLNTGLTTPQAKDDVHMGLQGMLCIDCHGGREHALRGRSIAVSVDRAHSLACEDCHQRHRHQDARLDTHLAAVACPTCHIPTHAHLAPTKLAWDWSQAGDGTRPQDEHQYQKKKGAFVYGQSLVPEYRWWDGRTGRYLAGDPVDPARTTELNPPLGAKGDKKSKIYPFKVHRGKQPYDLQHEHLLTPQTTGPTGYWTTFDWDGALRQGAQQAGLAYSGQYGFVATAMYWPLNHLVRQAGQALACADCHGAGGRLDWAALGYDADPAGVGGRR